MMVMIMVVVVIDAGIVHACMHACMTCIRICVSITETLTFTNDMYYTRYARPPPESRGQEELSARLVRQWVIEV